MSGRHQPRRPRATGVVLSITGETAEASLGHRDRRLGKKQALELAYA